MARREAMTKAVVCRCLRPLSILVAVDTMMGNHQESEQIAPKVANILSVFQSTTTTTAITSTTTITSNTSHSNEEKGQNPKPVEAPPHPAPVADLGLARLSEWDLQR